MFNTPHHLFRRFCPFSRRTINFPDLNPDHDRHRPLPLPRWLCTRKCGLYKLCAPLFTGLTTYLRELDPLDSISIFSSTLSLSLPMSCTSHSPRDETYQTLSLAVFMPHIHLLSFDLFISRVVSFASHMLTSHRSKRIIKSALYKTIHCFPRSWIYRLGGYLVKTSSVPCNGTSLGRTPWRTCLCTCILNVSTIHVPELTRLSDNRSSFVLAFKVRSNKVMPIFLSAEYIIICVQIAFNIHKEHFYQNLLNFNLWICHDWFLIWNIQDLNL